jgi:hypothetical protein
MKAFIVAALLVATVAGQSMDLMDLIKDKSLYKYKPTHRSMSSVEDLLLKEKLGRHVMDYNTKDSVFDMEDMSSVFGGHRGVSVLSLEELVSHPLFREYLQIPLFRQFWEQYPTIFRHYVESPLFQKFWTVPQFQMYFRNPMYFYKYIVPQVKVISESVTPYTTEGVYDFGTSTRFNPYTYQPRYNREWSVPMSMSSMMGQRSTYDYPTTTTHYKYLLEKMMNHMNMNKMGQDITETFTDVKMLPNGHIKEQTFGKIVDPITGNEKYTVGDVKLVDEKIVPVQHNMDFPTVGIEGMTNKYQMNKIFGHHNTENIKNILLKHIILNKIYGDKPVITPEVYRTLFGEHKEVFPEVYNTIFKHKNVMTPEILETVFGQNKDVYTPEVYETLFNTKKTFTPEIFDTVFGENKKVLTPELIEILMKGNKHVLSPRVLETVFGKKVYTPEVYGKLFNENVFDDVTYEPMTYNKMNKFDESPLITRMFKNNRFSPKMDVMTLKEKIQTEKMIEEIQKEKIMGQLYKNKDSLYSVESEFPTMTERKVLSHIPLTFTKPVRGSGIEEFLREKEIKY